MQNKILSFLYSLIIFSPIFGAGTHAPDFEVTFSHKLSSNRANYWSFRHEGLPKFPKMSDQDLLAFNVVKITARKHFFEAEQVVEEDNEISSGYFAWSSYQNPINAVKTYYGIKKEPLLVTCGHCVREWPKAEEIQSFQFDMHYVDPTNERFYQLTISLSNSAPKVPWILGERDIAALRFGKILQQGKEYLDNKVHAACYPFFEAIAYRDYDPDERGYLSDVVMFGYPYGLSASNSMPLARFGYCSTNPRLSIWKDCEEGTADFFVDMASIAGSSGSPIWFHSRELTGTLKDTKVTVEDGEVNDEEVEEDSGKLKLIDTKVTIDEAYLDDDDVEIKESKYFHFAGMLFQGPERADGVTHDIHLGGVFNAKTVFDFVHSIHFQA